MRQLKVFYLDNFLCNTFNWRNLFSIDGIDHNITFKYIKNNTLSHWEFYDSDFQKVFLYVFIIMINDIGAFITIKLSIMMVIIMTAYINFKSYLEKLKQNNYLDK